MSEFTTSLVIQFGQDAADERIVAALRAELDTRPDGFNSGRSRFKIGEKAYIIVTMGEPLTITPYTSAGTLKFSQKTDIEFTEVVAFVDQKASVSRAVKNIKNREWMGNNGGAITHSGRDLTSSATVKVAVAKITYVAEAHIYYLESPTAEQIGVDGMVTMVLVGTM
jgi:hypothetical protein